LREQQATEKTVDTVEFFAPGHTDVVPSELLESRPLPWWRLAVRILACVAALVAIDAAVATTVPPGNAYLADYRLPRRMPTASLADYADAVESLARGRAGAGVDSGTGSSSGEPVVLFLGASPTWGHRVQSARYTFPYAFAAAAASDSVALRSFNLACNGQFAGDQYLIAKRLAPSADVVFVQLTYHTFNPSTRAGKVVRFPELPALLDVRLTGDEIALLHLDPARVTGPEAAADRWLRRYWLLWRQRDALDRLLFGGRPQDVLAGAVARWRGETVTTDEDPPADGFADFDSLEPEQQMVVVAQYAENADFTLSASDPEVAVLSRLAGMLKARDKRAVFFVSPLNMWLVREYGLIDAAQYAGNMAVIRRAIAGGGFPLLDLNADAEALPRSAFADISHTTDAGARMVGALLWRETGTYVRGGAWAPRPTGEPVDGAPAGSVSPTEAVTAP
jgi:hypothetical protein